HNNGLVTRLSIAGNVVNVVPNGTWHTAQQPGNPGVAPSAPMTMVASEMNQLDVFFWGPNNSGLTRVECDGKVRGQPSGIATSIAPTPHRAVSWGPGRIDLFGASVDHKLAHTWKDDLGWHDETIGAAGPIDPLYSFAVGSWGPKRL